MTKVGKIVVENGVKENLPGCPFCFAILEEKQEVATQQKKARRSCFHLLHQEFFLLGIDPTKASVT